ncbi:hypothetical protein BC834DRAFT_519486 [Gloeopeniophorella convolvens]|nr:hypothetical protein BC834DRAFT_519486 [Gloeopeniophorella convolvens]
MHRGIHVLEHCPAAVQRNDGPSIGNQRRENSRQGAFGMTASSRAYGLLFVPKRHQMVLRLGRRSVSDLLLAPGPPDRTREPAQLAIHRLAPPNSALLRCIPGPRISVRCHLAARPSRLSGCRPCLRRLHRDFALRYEAAPRRQLMPWSHTSNLIVPSLDRDLAHGHRDNFAFCT